MRCAKLYVHNLTNVSVQDECVVLDEDLDEDELDCYRGFGGSYCYRTIVKKG